MHPRFQTPDVVTLVTGVGVVFGAAFFPVGKLADIANSGTLVAVLVVLLAVMLLRRRDRARPRPLRTPALRLIGPVSALGCIALFFFLPTAAKRRFPVWASNRPEAYFGSGWRKSRRRSR